MNILNKTRRSGRCRSVTLQPLVGLCLLLPVAVAQDTREQIENTRPLFQELFETQRAMSKEKRDGEMGQELLRERIRLKQRELDDAREKLDETTKKAAGIDSQLTELRAESNGLEASRAALVERVEALEERVRRLVKKLPPPLLEKLEAAIQRLPADSKNTDTRLLERFQNVVLILNSANKFNREISHNPEVRELANGTRVQVSVIYLGLGQAYYVDAGHRNAGSGLPGPEGWVWTPADHAAQEIAKALGIVQSGKTPEFVRLPLRIE